jgi:hypothetical protein
MKIFEGYFLLGILLMIVVWGGAVLHGIFYTNRPSQTASGEEL